MALESVAIRVSLWCAAATGVGVLLRSGVWMSQGAYVHLRPWCTVIASLLLVTGAIAGLRGRTWGILMAGLSGTAFLGAWLVGIGPLFFVGVAAVALAPTLATSRRLFGFDASAAAVALLVALVFGVIASLAAGPGLEALGLY